MTTEEIQQLANLLEKAKQELTTPSGKKPEYISIYKDEVIGETPTIYTGGWETFTIEEGKVMYNSQPVY